MYGEVNLDWLLFCVCLLPESTQLLRYSLFVQLRRFIKTAVYIVCTFRHHCTVEFAPLEPERRTCVWCVPKGFCCFVYCIVTFVSLRTSNRTTSYHQEANRTHSTKNSGSEHKSQYQELIEMFELSGFISTIG